MSRQSKIWEVVNFHTKEVVFTHSDYWKCVKEATKRSHTDQGAFYVQPKDGEDGTV
jgi:hypothetical protein